MAFLPSLLLILRRRRAVAVRGAAIAAFGGGVVYAYSHARGASLLLASAALAMAVGLYLLLRRGDRSTGVLTDYSTREQLRLVFSTLAIEAVAALYLVGVHGFDTAAVAVMIVPTALTAVRGSGLDASMTAATAALVVALGGAATGAWPGALDNAILVGGVGLLVAMAGGASRRAALDFSALYETGRALTSSLRQEDLLPLLLDIAMTDLDADVGAVFLIDRETAQYEVATARGLPEGYVPSSDDVAGSICSWAVDNRGPALRSEGLADDPVLSRLGMPVHEAIAVPLVSGRGPVGVILAAAYRKRGFTAENARFLEALASQASAAVENAMLYRQTAYWAIRDGLTGLYNYRHFAERLEIELARGQRYQKPVSLLIMDIDLFKRVNDEYGHLVGDEVLRGVAARLVDETRDSDLVARYGGEEFAVVLPETEFEAALLTAEKLRSAIGDTPVATVGPDARDIRVTVSIGVATFPTTVGPDHIVSQADEALYAAKGHRDCVSSVYGHTDKVGSATELLP